ncbi:MAG: hypothetical protein AAGI30_04960 [Planctomycetota bacterium]
MSKVLATSAAVLAVMGVTASVQAAPIPLADGGSVYDLDSVGIVPSSTSPDRRNSALWNITSRSDRRVRAFFEFDITGLAGPVIQSATVSAGFFEQLGFNDDGVIPGNAPSSVGAADITYFIYGGDGVITSSDYENFTNPAVQAITVGTLTRPDGSANWVESLVGTDLTAAVQAIVDAGFDYVGFGAQLNPSINFTSRNLRLSELDIDIVAVPAPGAAGLLGVAGIAAARRRR